MMHSLKFALACGVAGIGLAGAVPAFAQKRDFDVPSMPASRAIQTFARQSGVSLLASGEALRGVTTNSVRGKAEVQEALDEMLRGTSLKATKSGDNAYFIRSVPPPAKIAYTSYIDRQAAPITPPLVEEVPAQKNDFGLEEIIVTAQKRAESLQKTPISATALGSAQLETLGISNINDMTSGAIPSLRVAPFSGRASSYNITMRGIASGDAAQISRDAGIAIYVDGVYLGRVQGLGSELFEVERMEILRGPQGTLFGRNAVGGALNIVSKKPTGEFGLDQKFEVSNYEGRGLVTHLNLPKFAGISVKIDGVLKRRDGWIENPLAGAKDWNSYSRRGIRVSALWEPTESLSFLYSFDKSRDASAGGYEQIGELIPAASHQFGPLIQQEPRRVTRGRLGAPLEPSIGKVEGHGLTASLQVNDDLEIKSITAYRKLSQTTYDQAAGAFYGFSPNGNSGRTSLADVDQDQFSQELQIIGSLDRLKYTLGAFYYEEDADDWAYSFRSLAWNATGTDYSIVDKPVNAPADRASVNHSKSTALYGQLTYTPALFDDRLHLTGGLRYTKDKKRGGLTTLRGVPSTLAYRFSSSRLDPGASISFDVSNATQVYLRWGVAYRAGGANSRSVTFRSFGEEEVESWEAGLKTEFWNRKGRFNIALFDMSYRDIQVDFVNPATPTNFETMNANGTAKIKGIEIDAALRPLPGLTIDGSYSYLHYRMPLTLNPFTGLPVTTFLTYTPKHAASSSIQYRFAETAIGTPFIHFDGSYATGSHSFPGDPYKTDSYFTANSRIGLEEILVGPGTLSSSFWMKNIFNEQHKTSTVLVSGNGTTNANWTWYNMPRTYGVELRYRF